MRQIWIGRAGGPENLQVRESPDPIPRTGEVRVRVAACGVNFLDLLGRMGAPYQGPRIPFAPGLELAGTIDIVGQGVATLKEGDDVLALTLAGGYSDLICLPQHRVFKRLDWMSAEDGAALPVSYVTAYLTLVVLGALRAGDRVLIHNAGGGVGVAAVDICRLLGAETFGTASPDKHAFLLERGLAQAIDYRRWDYERVVRDLTNGEGVDLILDPLGGNHWRKNYRLLRATGCLVCFGASSIQAPDRFGILSRIRPLLTRPSFHPPKLMRENKGIAGFNLFQLGEDKRRIRQAMEQIIHWYDEALFRPHIDGTYSFARAAEAHTRLEERKNIGKVLLIP